MLKETFSNTRVFLLQTEYGFFQELDLPNQQFYDEIAHSRK